MDRMRMRSVTALMSMLPLTTRACSYLEERAMSNIISRVESEISGWDTGTSVKRNTVASRKCWM